jgi:hypothetical protein
MKYSQLCAAVGLSLFLLAAAPSKGNVVYTWSGEISGGGFSPTAYSWSFDAGPSLLTTTTTISSFLTTSISGDPKAEACTISSAQIKNPAVTLDVQTNFSGCSLLFTENGPTDTQAPVPLTAPGTYHLEGQDVTLVISQTPEASSLALFGLGLAFLGGRRIHRAVRCAH